MLRRWLWRGLQATTLLTAALSVVALAQNPFAAPYIERGAAEAQLAIDRMLVREVTPGWIATELEAAVLAEDLDRTTLLLALAERLAIAIPTEARAAADDFVAAEKGTLRTAERCGACFVDPNACATPALLMACNIPLELTVIGDAKVLSVAALDHWQGEAIDRFDVALALTGLGATGLVVATGGTSASVKVGATAIRVAKRMNRLTPGFQRTIADAAAVPIRTERIADYMRGAAPLEAVTDTARLARLGRIATDLGTVRRETSAADTLFLLAHVESAEDAADLARVARAAGPETRPAIEVLGLARTTRALTRLSDLAVLTLTLLGLLLAQLAGLAAPLALRGLRRAVAPSGVLGHHPRG